MQSNFEKNVQQKMDELRLTPSAPVWEKIELEIRPEKKRRGILWFVLAGLLLVGDGLLHQSVNENLQPLAKQTALPPQSAWKESSDDHSTTEKKENATTKRKEKTGIELQKSTVEKSAKLRVQKKAPTDKYFNVAEKKPSLNLLQSKEPSSPVAVVAQEKSNGIAREKEAQAPVKEVQKIAVIDRPDTQVVVKEERPNEVDSASSKAEVKEDALRRIDTTIKRKIASANKWKKQVMLNIGQSSYAESSLQKSLSNAAFYASAPPATPSPGVSSKATAGLQFAVGFSLAKALGKRWEIAAGLQFVYASTHQRIGDKKTTDTTVNFASAKAAANGFYTNTGTNNYTACFHFIEVPVNVSFKPSLRLPLYVSVGAAYGRLLSTTALTFSPASNLYYINKDNYLRNSLPFSSSVQVELLAKKKFSIRTGPFLQYNLLKLRSENTDGTPHLLFAGLKMTIDL